MTKGVIRFSSIGQYRDVITSVTKLASFHKLPLPKLRFRGLTKLHGTNAAIVYDPDTDKISIQSRNNTYEAIDIKNQDRDASHMGFNEFAHRSVTKEIVRN